MTEEKQDLGTITELTYLHLYNPLRWEGNIRNNFQFQSNKQVLKMLNECGTAYLVQINKKEEDFQWYLPMIRKEFGPDEVNELADWFLEERMKEHAQYISDVKEIYKIIRAEALIRGMNDEIKKYPDTLEELTN